MKRVVAFFLSICAIENASAVHYSNVTLDPASRQLLDFKLTHPVSVDPRCKINMPVLIQRHLKAMATVDQVPRDKCPRFVADISTVNSDALFEQPIGVLTTSAGKPVEVRETVTLNTDFFNNQYFWDLSSGADQERIPERTVHARGTGAYGYFEVTNDVSKYTKADVFNGVGKKTPLFVRFSYLVQSIGGLDLVRETAALVAKFYTNEGNLDLLCLNFPVFLYNTPHAFSSVAHAFKRNPKTNTPDATARLDILTRLPELIHQILWLFSDYGITNGYRKMDAFPIHTYEINNKHGESYFVKFNFRTEQGVELITDQAAAALRAKDPDYSTRDLYNAIATGNFPAWRLDMDVIPKRDLPKLNYNPFDITLLWRNGTYHTVTIGRLVLNRNSDNLFKDAEQAAFNPGNLVPGIPGPPDDMFKARRFSYRDAQAYRLGINHNNIEVNKPKYRKIYNRDGVPPVLENMKDAPNYYQNSFNGPVPFVDEARPKEALSIKFRQSVDLGEPAYFYNTYVNTEGKRNRLAASLAGVMVNAVESISQEWLQILYLIDRDLGRRTEMALQVARVQKLKDRPRLLQVEDYPKTLDLIPNDVCHDRN